MKSWTWIVLGLFVAGCQSTGAGRPHPGVGTLLVVGGGGTPDVVLERGVAIAGATDVDVAVVPYASGRDDRGEGAAEMWLEAGARHVWNLDGLPGSEAAERIAEAEIVWMIGGDQNRLVEAVRDEGLVEALAAAWSRGAVFGGTSAGAAVMSERMLTGDADLEAIRAGTTATTAGFNLWPDVVVDQHFLARRRHNRLLGAVLDGAHEIGVGIDERTAVIVHPGNRCEVVGEGAVVLYDARRAAIAEAEPGALRSARSVVMHVLTAGETFDLSR